MPGSTKLALNLTRGNVLAERIAIADRPLTRMRGVLGRQALPPGEGFLLQPAPSIHTAFVRFEFDAVFLDLNLRVVRVVRRVKPWRIVSARRAGSVLELAAGEAQRRLVHEGDQIVMSDPLAAAAPRPDDDDRLPAARILLIGADRRYRATACILLQRRGYEVVVSERATALAEQAKEHAADVLIVDAGSLPTVASLEMARLEAMNPAVGFVVVGDQLARPVESLSMVPKWGSFEHLADAIESARARQAA